MVIHLVNREEINADKTDPNGRSALSWAAGNGHGDIVNLLLSWEDVEPGLGDIDGKTPLF